VLVQHHTPTDNAPDTTAQWRTRKAQGWLTNTAPAVDATPG
jgi:hypothetical protein